MRRISGPLLDRIDMHIEVPSVEYEAMRRREKPETSAQVRQRVNAARDIQKRRFAGTAVSCNAYMTPAMIGEYCLLDQAGERLMKGAFDRLAHAAMTAFSAWPAPSPTWTAVSASKPPTWLRPFSTAAAIC